MAAGIPLGEGEEAIPAGADTQEAEVIVSPSAAPLFVLNLFVLNLFVLNNAS
jgi:hypothetical protein